MRIVLVLEMEYHLSLTVVKAFWQSLDGQSDLGLAFPMVRIDLTPAWFALYIPFSFSIYHKGLLVLRIQSASHRRATHQFMMHSDSLEITPAI